MTQYAEVTKALYEQLAIADNKQRCEYAGEVLTDMEEV